MFSLTTVIIVAAASFAAGLLAVVSAAGFRSRNRFRVGSAEMRQRLEELRNRARQEGCSDLSGGMNRWMAHHVENLLDKCGQHLDAADSVWRASHWGGRSALREAESVLIEAGTVLNCLSSYLPSILALQCRGLAELRGEVLEMHGRLSRKILDQAAGADLADEKRELGSIGETMSRCREPAAEDLSVFLRQTCRHLARLNRLASDIDRKVGSSNRSRG